MCIYYICLFVIINQHVCTTEEGQEPARQTIIWQVRANAKNSDMRVPVCDLRLYLIESNVRAFVLSLILIISPIRDTFLVHIHSTAAGWEHSIIMSRTCGYFTMPPIIQSMELYYFSFGKKFYARQRQQHHLYRVATILYLTCGDAAASLLVGYIMWSFVNQQRRLRHPRDRLVVSQCWAVDNLRLEWAAKR